jgi:hypothetical protein
MSVKQRGAALLAGLALAGSACVTGIAAAPAADAATPQCGANCVSLYNQEFGSGYVSAVSGGTAAAGQAVILSAAAPSASEDFTSLFEGLVSDFYAAGLMNATLEEHYGGGAAGAPDDPVFEFEYTPDGADSGLCLGVASGPRQSTKVTLQPCGVSVKTTWILDQADSSSGYAPLVNGNDSRYPAPYVLTANSVGGKFSTQALRTSGGTIDPAQMWQAQFGVLP